MTEPYIARSLEEVQTLLSRPGGRLFAGGTAADTQTVDYPVSITEVPNLAFFRDKGNKAELGPLVTLETIAASMPLRKKVPALTAAVLTVGTPELRSRATLGGNLSQGFIGTLALPLLAANAQITLKTEEDYRELPLERFYNADGRPNLNFDEVLIKIAFSACETNEWEGFQRDGLRDAEEDHSTAAALRIKWDAKGRICSARCFGAAYNYGYIRLRSVEKLLKGNMLHELPKLDLSRAKIPETLLPPLRGVLTQASEFDPCPSEVPSDSLAAPCQTGPKDAEEYDPENDRREF